ncbi:hypothetical protein CK203_108607 [Vitis vinifera]|uniref:Uncharacterized protein n=1 Tax=Vitis vinifera TaxID=29760 RepID=A0A438CY56_VITVI|nr:hypothetical protein CK203_108607 [Vitis vinifera]
MARDLSTWLRTSGLLVEIDLGSRAWIRIDLLEVQIHTVKDRWASGPAIVDSGEQLAQLYYTHLHHCHRGLLYNRIIQFHLRHHPQFNQPHELELFVLHGWDGYDDLLVAALPVEFRMLDIERPSMALRRTHLEIMGRLFPFRLKGEEVRARTQIIRYWCHRRDRTQVPSSPSVSYTIFRHSLLDDTTGSVQTGYSFQANRAYLSTSATTASICYTGRIDYRRYHPDTTTTYPTRIQDRFSLCYHQRVSHDTDSCATLRHAIQNLIDQGLVDLGSPAVTIDPLPAHDTRVVPPTPGGVHLIVFSGDEIFMMGWDGEAPQPISLYEDSYFSGYIHGQDVQIVTRSGNVAQPPLVERPFAGTDARDEIQMEDDEILCQLCTIQACISIWNLLASSNTHRDALIRALS